MKIIKRVRAPVRVDFAGGTTDIKPFTDIHGGAVLNAAINHYVYGTLIATDYSTNLEYNADIPTSSGLGTSSAMNDVWVALITHLKDKKKIAEDVFNIEHAIAESAVNGKQDMYAAAYGGINYMEFIGDKVIVHPLNLSKKIITELEENLVLVYSGKPHLSGNSNKAAIDNLLKGRNDEELLKIKQIAIDMKDFLLKGDLNGFSHLMNLETEQRAKLSKITLSPQLKKIIDTGLKNGGVSAKICGSGGGGSILFYADNPGKLKKFFGKKVIPFKFDFEGLKWM
jgi:D-glycero-alpha-D-manno-heptose-7-phosphate kinase